MLHLPNLALSLGRQVSNSSLLVLVAFNELKQCHSIPVNLVNSMDKQLRNRLLSIMPLMFNNQDQLLASPNRNWGVFSRLHHCIQVSHPRQQMSQVNNMYQQLHRLPPSTMSPLFSSPASLLAINNMDRELHSLVFMVSNKDRQQHLSLLFTMASTSTTLDKLPHITLFLQCNSLLVVVNILASTLRGGKSMATRQPS